jgi:hypothetical protein
LVSWSVGQLVIWLFGYLVIWLFGYLVIWLFGYLVIWLFGYLVSWLAVWVAKLGKSQRLPNPHSSWLAVLHVGCRRILEGSREGYTIRDTELLMCDNCLHVGALRPDCYLYTLDAIGR